MNDDERIAYLAGDTGARLDHPERAELDALHSVLSDPAIWAEPRPDLQERIVSEIARDASAHRRSQWVRYTFLATAAAVLLGVVLTVALTRGGGNSVQYAASLSGTELNPQGSGHVTLTRTSSGWKIYLEAKGLPRRDNGAYYEAWLKNRAGVLVPVGTFNESDHDVTLWAGVAPSSYPMLTVTRQLAGTGQATSGQVVLIGTAHRTH